MKNGIPWAVAEGMDEVERLAAVVVFGQFEGNTFDWNEMRFVRRDA